MLPPDARQDRCALSLWIDAQARLAPVAGNGPTSKQVVSAKRIARIKRRAVPDEYFWNRQLLSCWIDRNQ
ncbi:hypothetical protein [Paracoccus alcaliphilus]|uniref:hypothetical protein n=1 Tax=Paracoccus alcaliphilus TaxID=34002 RepID=UPI000A5E8FF1